MWKIERLLSQEALLQVPFTLDDAIHPDYWRLDLTLPAGARVLGVVVEEIELRITPALLAIGDPALPAEGRTFLIAAARRSVHSTEPFLRKVRFVDSFQRRVGRLGGVGWRTFDVFEVPGISPQPVHEALPRVARRTSLNEMFSLR